MPFCSCFPDIITQEERFVESLAIGDNANSGGKSSVHLSVTGAAGHAQMDGTFAPTDAKALNWGRANLKFA